MVKNIFVASKDPWDVRIGDFGISKHVIQGTHGHNTRLRTLNSGTPGFTAPEVLYDNLSDSDDEDEDESHGYSNKVDIWSLGCVVYELVTQKLPFPPENRALQRFCKRKTAFPEEALVGKIHQSGVQLIKSLLSVTAHERPTAEEVLRADWLKVQSCSTSIQQTQISVSAPASFEKPSKSHGPDIMKAHTIPISMHATGPATLATTAAVSRKDPSDIWINALLSQLQASNRQPTNHIHRISVPPTTGVSQSASSVAVDNKEPDGDEKVQVAYSPATTKDFLKYLSREQHTNSSFGSVTDDFIHLSAESNLNVTEDKTDLSVGLSLATILNKYSGAKKLFPNKKYTGRFNVDWTSRINPSILSSAFLSIKRIELCETSIRVIPEAAIKLVLETLEEHVPILTPYTLCALRFPPLTSFVG